MERKQKRREQGKEDIDRKNEMWKENRQDKETRDEETDMETKGRRQRIFVEGKK